MTYFSESLFKKQFIEAKENKLMHQNLKTVLESMPEGVLIFEKGSKEVLYQNDKIIKLLNSNGREGPPQH